MGWRLALGLVVVGLAACDAAAWQEAAKGVNDAQYGASSSSGGPQARQCVNDDGCMIGEVCVQQGTTGGVCVRKR